MEQISNEIRVGYSDREINALLAAVTDVQRPFSRHFNQSEDFFLLLEDDYTVPHLPIHHDVRLARAEPRLRGRAARRYSRSWHGWRRRR